MRSPASASLAAVALLLALAGCAAAPLPAPPTAEDAARHYELMLDRTWQTTGLSGLMDRPAVEAADPLPPDQWVKVLFNCMAESGYTLTGITSGAGSGFELANEGTEAPLRSDSALQLAFYTCLAAHPAEAPFDRQLLSGEQLDYIYDFYARWTVPCLLLNGYQMGTAISREEFIAREGDWTPFEALIPFDVSDFDTSVELCGPLRPPLD